METHDTATCPICSRQDCKVKESHTIPTRWEPSQSLGHSGYCPDCAVSFKVEAAQVALTLTTNV